MRSFCRNGMSTDNCFDITKTWIIKMSKSYDTQKINLDKALLELEVKQNRIDELEKELNLMKNQSIGQNDLIKIKTKKFASKKNVQKIDA